MTIEAGCVITKFGCLWHLPPGRSAGYLPDSPDLWQVMWDNREFVDGFAHSHPGSGRAACDPSNEDVTTFSAVERALGKRLRWWICSRDCLVEYLWGGGAYEAVKPSCDPRAIPSWVHTLREVSGHHLPMFQCGCGAPCEAVTGEPMMGWTRGGGSVVPGPWVGERRLEPAEGRTCVYCAYAGRQPAGYRGAYAALDQVAIRQTRVRHSDVHRTDLCPVWDSVHGHWVESDEHLRERVKETLK